ncbi:MAG TPA: hypothetical protein VKT18_04870, partial [Acidimicrobiales bacterium]|nr:hypothetical protein [Acidimicrobiales bacterium]
VAACAAIAIAATGAGAAASGLQAAAPRWIDYFNTRVGSTCVASGSGHVGAIRITSTGSQRTLSVDRTAAGTVVRYSLTTNVTETPATATVPMLTIRSLAYTFRVDGTVATDPGDYSFGPFRYTFSQAEVYPTIAELRAGVRRSGVLELTVAGTTAATRAGLAQYLLPGHATADVALRYTVAPAPPRSTIVTPAGSFHDLVGVVFAEHGVSGGDLSSAGRLVFSTVLDKLAAGLATTSYFARGVGPVWSSAPAFGPVLLERCSG